MTLPTRSNVTNPAQWGYDVRLGETYLRLAARPRLSELVVESAPLQADRVDTRTTSEEVSNEFGLLFARADFSGGEGLERAHSASRQSIDDSRYYDSKNIDIDDDGRAQLLATSERVDASSASVIYAVYADGNVWYTDGTTLQKSTNPTADPPSFSADDPHAGEGAQNVTGLAALGTTAYAACTTNGIHRITSGGAWAHWSDVQADRIWAAKGRIIALEDNVLYEARSAATSLTLLTLGDGHVIHDVVDAGRFILAAASDGLVYAFTFNGTDVEFAGQSTPISTGEYPTALHATLGRVFIATAEDLGSGSSVGRLYTGVLADDGVLDNLSVIKEWDESTADLAPRGLHSPRRASIFLGNPQGTETHLWRYDLSTDGLHRSYITTEGAGCVRSVFSVDDRVWWTVDGEGISRESGTTSSTGYIIGPFANFFTEDQKSWSGLRAIFDQMPSGSKVRTAYTTDRDALDDPDSGQWISFSVYNTSNEERELSLPEVEARALAIKFSFELGDDTPILRSYTVRAYPGAGDTLLSLPVNVSDRIERRGRLVEVTGRGDEVFSHLLGLEGRALELELVREGTRFSGTVQQVSQPSPLTPSRGSRWMVSTVVFRGRQVASASSSNNGFGVGLFGEGLFGQREGIAA